MTGVTPIQTSHRLTVYFQTLPTDHQNQEVSVWVQVQPPHTSHPISLVGLSSLHNLIQMPNL